MSHEHETLNEPTGANAAEELRPDFLARARRILRGDIRPEDYLPVTPEIRAAADFELAYVRDHMKIEPLPEVVADQLRDWMLSFHCGGKNIAYIAKGSGVIVLAVESEIGELIDYLDTTQRDGVVFTCPEPF